MTAACKFCRCTEDRACIKPNGEPCGWADAVEGVCDHPACLVAYMLDGAVDDATAAAITAVVRERLRQVQEEGYNPKHDDKHDEGQIADAAACYAVAAAERQALERRYAHDQVALSTLKHHQIPPPRRWPWELLHWKPTDPRRDLEKAGALGIAALEVIIRRDAGLSAETPE